MTPSGPAVLVKLDGVEVENKTDRTMKLLIVDNAPTRAGIRMALGDDVFVCAEETELELAIRAAKREQPDIAFIGRDRRHLYANREYAGNLGVPAEEIVGETIAELLGEAYYEKLRPFGERALLSPEARGDEAPEVSGKP